MKLYEINQAFRDWQAKIELQEGELTEEDLKALEELNIIAGDKIDAYSVIIKESLAEAEIFEQEGARLMQRAKRSRAVAERLKGNLDYFMQQQGLENFKSTKAVISYRKSVALKVDETVKIPKKWYRVKTEIDKSAIKDFLKNGGKVKGCALIENKKIQVK